MKVFNHIPKYSILLEQHCAPVNDEETGRYKSLYHLYEYTDDICVLEDTSVYPGIINYVKTGILTPEEMVEALLL